VEGERKRLKITSAVPVNLGDSVIKETWVLATLILESATKKVSLQRKFVLS
jgi:hypothetical protein